MVNLIFNENYCKKLVAEGHMSYENGKYYLCGKEVMVTENLPDYEDVIFVKENNQNYIDKMINYML